MSTILDALRKLQRERAAQTPDKDLRGSVTHESSRSRRRGSGARNLGLALALLAVVGGGYTLHRSGQLQELLARFNSEDAPATDEDFAEIEREILEAEAAAAAQEAAVAAQEAAAQAQSPPAADSPPDPAPVARLARSPRNAPQPNVAGAPGESPEILAERARLEAALANARAAQEAQQQAARDAEAAQQAAANPPAAAASAPPTPTPTPATQKRVVAKRPVMPGEPAAAAQPQAKPQPKPEPKPEPKPAAEEIEARAVPRAADEPVAARTAFPEVWVESIRWHPIAERRVTSLRFERQDAPEAREGDIVAGVLVYRIDPGSVELRVGNAQRTVSPGP